MSAEESRQQALRCIQVAKQTEAPKLKELLLAQADAWRTLADEQERIEKRARERASTEGEPPKRG
jgi:hypothetical protein